MSKKTVLSVLAFLALASGSIALGKMAFAAQPLQMVPGPTFEKLVHCTGNYPASAEKQGFACAYGLATANVLAQCQNAGCQVCNLLDVSTTGVREGKSYDGYARIQGLNCTKR